MAIMAVREDREMKSDEKKNRKEVRCQFGWVPGCFGQPQLNELAHEIK